MEPSRPALEAAERRRLNTLPDATRERAIELMAEIERGYGVRRNGAGKWGKLLTAIERLEERQRQVA